MLRRTAAALLIPIAVLAVSCGDDAKTASKSYTCESAQAAAKKKGATSVSTDPQGVSDEIEKRGKPKVSVPHEPATKLCIIDDIVGAGAEVQASDTITAQYIGVGQKSGSEFNSSWRDNGGKPIQFPLNRVIQGWTEGLTGMKAGGRRTLIIPGEMAYGANPPSAEIAPGETLVFTVDLVSIDS